MIYWGQVGGWSNLSLLVFGFPHLWGRLQEGILHCKVGMGKREELSPRTASKLPTVRGTLTQLPWGYSLQIGTVGLFRVERQHSSTSHYFWTVLLPQQWLVLLPFPHAKDIISFYISSMCLWSANMECPKFIILQNVYQIIDTPEKC